MPQIRAQVTLRTASGVAEDFVTNSWAFKGTAPAGDTTGITAALAAFYSAIRSAVLPGTIVQNGHEIKYTELPGAKPNYPFLTSVMNLSASPSGAELPSECAIVLSFEGSKAAGFPQARRRGRVFLGPVLSSANSAGRPSAATITAITTAASAFKTAINALPSDTQWAIWSPSDGNAVEVVSGWVDNSFDTQRRRGIRTNSRTTWT